MEAAMSEKNQECHFRPLRDHILVKRLDDKEKTIGGIIIPDAAKEKAYEAQVVAVGSGKLTEKGERQSLEVKPGDRIYFSKYVGNEIDLNGEKHLILREEDVLGVFH
jgi:chaperonin GroES